MKTFKYKTINSVEGVKTFEHVSSKVSEKYVPIYTSNIIKELEPNFKFKKAGQYNRTKSAHYVEMTKGTDIELYIENSFDRSLSLRTSFKYNNFVFGYVKQIHKGAPAEEIANNYGTLSEMYNRATNLVRTLNRLEFTNEQKMEIFIMLLKERNISLKRVIKPERYTYDIKLSAMEYIDYVLDLFYNQGIEVVGKRGIRSTRPIKNEFTKINLSRKLYKWVHDFHPELAI